MLKEFPAFFLIFASTLESIWEKQETILRVLFFPVTTHFRIRSVLVVCVANCHVIFMLLNLSLTLHMCPNMYILFLTILFRTSKAPLNFLTSLPYELPKIHLIFILASLMADWELPQYLSRPQRRYPEPLITDKLQTYRYIFGTWFKQ